MQLNILSINRYMSNTVTEKVCSVLLVEPYYESTHKRSAEEEAQNECHSAGE